MTHSHTPVLVVGAGPVGLTMASELNRHGIECRIVEKEAQPSVNSKALALQARSLEAWDDMGIADQLIARGNPIEAMSLYEDKAKLGSVDFAPLPSKYPFILGLPQKETEAVLNQHVNEQGIKVERNCEVLDFQFDKSGFTVQLSNGGGEPQLITTDWLIASDGAHSLVRKKLKLPFEGKKLDLHFIMADLELEEELPKKEVHIFFTPKGPAAIIPMRNFYRVFAEVSKYPKLASKQEPTKEDFIRILKAAPFDVKVKNMIWQSSFAINERIVPDYCYRHKIFLMGDAAHVHSPVGGQGLNTGIQDAYNLAWKLALVIKGKAKKSLLDTYSKERRPVAHSMLKETTISTKVIATHNEWLQKIRNFGIKHMLKREAVCAKIRENVAQMVVNYKKSPIVSEYTDEASREFRYRLKAGSRIAEGACEVQGKPCQFIDVLRGTHCSLVFFTGEHPSETEKGHILSVAEKIKQKHGDLIKTYLVHPKGGIAGFENWDAATKCTDVKMELHKGYGATNSCMYLIRPDKYVGFRSQPVVWEALEKYLKGGFLVQQEE